MTLEISAESEPWAVPSESELPHALRTKLSANKVAAVFRGNFRFPLIPTFILLSPFFF
jgi:hypothetical protein